MELALLIGAFAVVLGVIILIVNKVEKARSERLQAIAAQLGLQFHSKGDPTVQEAHGHLRLFKLGRDRESKNLLSGQTQDIDLAIFGYSYVTGSGKSHRTHQQSVISFQSPDLSLPEFELRPEGMFHKIGQSFGYQDIDFDSNPTFSKRYLLRGPDESAIRDLFTPEVLVFFESQNRVCVEASNDRLIYYRARKRIKPEDVQSFMEEGFCLFGLLKQEPVS